MYALKIVFNDMASGVCMREEENAIREQLLKHTNGDMILLKELFDDARRGNQGDSTWGKIEAISRFNALLGHPEFTPADISKTDIQYQWIKYKEKREIR